MNYRDFNRRVYKYYLENLIPGEYNTLTIPKGDFDELIEDEAFICNFKEIKTNDWSLLLKNDDGIPRYLGLLAIQCHAAFHMQNDGRISAGNFRDRFITIVGIKSTLDLHQLFSEKFNNNLNIQEKIWIEAKSFFEKQNIFLDIPQPKSFARKNTQYPESQCVLNYEDLNEYMIFYNHICSNYDTIHFGDFITEFKKFKTRLVAQFTRENNFKSFFGIEEKIKRRQIFDFYNSFDWKIFSNGKFRERRINNDFIAKLDSDNLTIYDENFEVFENYPCLLDKNNLAFFKQDEVYSNEFSKCKHIDKNDKIILITPSRIILDELLNYNGSVINLYSNVINLYAILIDIKNEIPSCLFRYLSREFPIKIIGKKISSKRQYLLSNLPRLESENGIAYRLFCNNTRVIENQPISQGEYLIKVNGFSPYAFEIIKDVKLEDEILETDFKLNLSALDYSFDGNMSGLGINAVNSEEKEILSIKQWVRSLTNRQTKINTTPNTNFLLKAINQHNYGKY